MRKKEALALLDDALAHLGALVDVDGTKCSVPSEAKDAVKNYVDTWVIYPVQQARNMVAEVCARCSHDTREHKHGQYSCNHAGCECYAVTFCAD